MNLEKKFGYFYLKKAFAITNFIRNSVLQIRRFALDDALKMIKIIFILSVGISSSVWAQNITEIEYFFDTDPGIGNGTSITAFTNGNEVTYNGTIQAATQSRGIHTLYLRAKNSNEEWGFAGSRLVLVDEGQVIEIDGFEYFFNTDPGIGQATFLSATADTSISLTTDIDASQLERGLHTLYVRARTTAGGWGVPVVQLVLVDEGQVIEIDGFEYFFDDDPGVGQGTFISTTVGTEIDLTTQIDASALEKGLHNLYIRARTSNGTWGMPEVNLVLVDEGSVIEISELEYFFNEDPGVGNATSIPVTTGAAIEVMTQINAEGLSEGIQNLYIRAKTPTGSWGIPSQKLVLVDKDDPNTISEIVSAEYFFDVDPGFGNASFLELTDASEIDEMVSINVDSLSAGPHTLYVRVLDEDGEWSMIVNQEVMVTIPPRLTDIEPDTLLFTENESLTIISESLKVIAEGGFQIDSAVVNATEGFIYGVEDQLNFTSNLQDSVQFSSESQGIFKFIGSASAALYQQIFRGIEYINVSDNPETSIKIVSFQVFGNEDSSEVASRSIQVIPVDDPPEKYAELETIILPEDVSDTLALRLNDFFRDFDSPISYLVNSADQEIDLQLVDDQIFISSAPNWYGEAELFIEVNSLEYTLIDTAKITITPINDTPFVRAVTYPIQLVEDFGVIEVIHLDSLFSDIDLPKDSLRYSIGFISEPNVLPSISNSVLSFSSIQDVNGNFSFSVIATDDSLASDSLEFNGVINPVNDAPYIVSSLPDTSVLEDADQFSLLNLNDYFEDVDSELNYELYNSSPNLNLDITELGDLLVSSSPNWNGIDVISIRATDEEFEVRDTLKIEVRSVNDSAPTQPILLAPNRGGETNLNTFLVWSLAKDTVEFEDPKPLYEIEIDSSQSFTSPIIAQSNIGLTTILQRNTKSNYVPYMQGEPADEDSVFAVRLGALEGAVQLEDDVHYFWRVRSLDNEDSASVWSMPWGFWLNLENDAPDMVVDGFTPSDSITVSSLTPTISWNAAFDVDISDTPNKLKYILELSSDTSFKNIVFIDTTLTGINSIMPDSLMDESMYYWRVKTIDDDEAESEWSGVQAFIINQKLNPPSPFELLTPLNGVDTLTDNPVFSWRSSNDVDLFDKIYYSFRLASDTLFNNLIVDEVLTSDTTYSLGDQLGVGTYFWQVMATDTDSLTTFGSNSGANPFNFTLVSLVPLLSNVETDTLVILENDPVTSITDSIQVMTDAGFQIDSAIVRAEHGFLFETEDQLYFTTDLQDSVSLISSSNGIFKFKGTASTSLYQQLFRGIEYENTSERPEETIKSLTFQVFANGDSSEVVSRNLRVVSVNDAPVLVNLLPDTSVIEDSDPFSLLNVNDYFDDVDSDLTFDIRNTESAIELQISEQGIVFVTIAKNWNGNEFISITASDEEFEVTDTLNIEVQSVNDASPTQPVLLAPNRGVESNLNTYLVWSLAKDTIEFEDPRPLYEVQIDSSELFNSPLINQSDIGLSTILQRTAKREFLSHLQSNPSDEDSVFAVRLGSLNGAVQLEDDVHYFWRVRSVDNEDSASVWSNTWDFILNEENNAPEMVTTGFTPADSITVSSINPTLSWNSAIDIDYSDTPNRLKYVIQLAQDDLFSNVDYSDTTEIGINSTETESLLDESIYFWRVKTVDDEGLESDWSETQTFIINQQLDPPTAFELQNPINGVDTLTVNPNFSWTSSSDTDLFDQVYYRYRLSEDSLFNNLLVDEILANDTTLILLEPLSIGEYFWKVVAIDTDSLFTYGSNSNDDPFKFTIVEKVTSELFQELPIDYSLSQNYPNPFNPSTTLQFGLPEASQVRLEVFNLLGQKVATLLENDLKQAGWHSIQFDAMNLSSGVYIYRIRAGEFVQTKRMMLIK